MSLCEGGASLSGYHLEYVLEAYKIIIQLCLSPSVELFDSNMLNIKHTNIEIRVAGLQRSGNHAVINWIIKQSGKNVLFFNDVDPENPLDESRLHSPNNIETSDECYDCVIYSYEDRILDLISHKNYYPQKNITNISAGQRIDVIILRNPFNALASRMKHAAVSSTRSTYISGLNVAQLWVTYAYEYLGKTSKLKNKKVPLNYDLWCTSEDYRKEIANLLGLEFTDAGFNQITAYGRGSSFDLEDYNERASEMKTDQRWKNYCDDECYIDLLNDKNLIQLTKKIFSIDKELEQFIDNRISSQQSWYSSVLTTLKIALLPIVVVKARQSAFIKYIYFSYLQLQRKRASPPEN